jgi:hypothetical protein
MVEGTLCPSTWQPPASQRLLPAHLLPLCTAGARGVSSPTFTSSRGVDSPSATHAAETTVLATAVAAQQSATAKQAAATYSAAASEAQLAQQAASLLTATAHQAAAQWQHGLAQEAAQQAFQAEQQAAALSAVAHEAASVYMDATQKAAEAHQQVAAARAEAVAAATQAVQAAATTLAASSSAGEAAAGQGTAAAATPPGSLPLSPPSATAPAQAPAPPQMAGPALAQQGSTGATSAGAGELPSRSSTFQSEASQSAAVPQLPPLSIEQAQQQLAFLQQYLAQQAQQVEHAAAAAGQGSLRSPPVLTPQPSALSYISSLDGSGNSLYHLALPVTPGVGAGLGAAGLTPAAAVPATLPAVLPGLPASAPLSAQIAAGVLVPAEAAAQPRLSPPSASMASVRQQAQQAQQAQQQQHALPNLVHTRPQQPQLVSRGAACRVACRAEVARGCKGAWVERPGCGETPIAEGRGAFGCQMFMRLLAAFWHAHWHAGPAAAQVTA